jgi:hypothetical protein
MKCRSALEGVKSSNFLKAMNAMAEVAIEAAASV